MQVNRIQSTNPNFGMAIVADKGAKALLENKLSKKGAKQLSKLIEAEKNNPTDIMLTTTTRCIDFPSGPYDVFQAKAGNMTYEWSTLDRIYKWFDSLSIISTIESAVKQARRLTENNNVLERIAEK